MTSRDQTPARISTSSINRTPPRNDTDPPGAPGGAPYRSCDHAWAFSSSSATLRVRFGSTWMPGPIVVETVTFLM